MGPNSHHWTKTQGTQGTHSPPITLISEQAWLHHQEMGAHPSSSLHQSSWLSCLWAQRAISSPMLCWGLGSELQPDGQAGVSPELGSSSPLALDPEQPFWDSCPPERLKAPSLPASCHRRIFGHKAFEILCHYGFKAPQLWPQREGCQGGRQKHGVSGTKTQRVGPYTASQ